MKQFGRRLEPAVPAASVAESHLTPAPLTPPNTSLQLRLRAKIMEQLDSGAVAEMSAETLRAELEPVIHEIAGKERVQLSARDQFQLAQELTDDMVGFGPLEPLLRDNTISDIMVNGPDTVFISGPASCKSNVRFRD